MIPLSAVTETVVANVPRAYRDTALREHKQAGDQLLLARLSQLQLRRQTMTGPLPAVRSFDELTLEQIVGEVERFVLRAGIRWQLAGDPGASLLDRIDEHFRGPMEAEVRRREEAERVREIQSEASTRLEQDVIVRNLERDRQLWALG